MRAAPRRSRPRPRGAPAGAPRPRRDLAAGGDAERDARPARGRVRARAALRRRRQPRAAHAARAAEDRARARAAPAAARAPSSSRRSARPEETERLTRLAEDLLLIARSDAGRAARPARAGLGGERARGRVRALLVRWPPSSAGRSRSQPPNGLLLDADPVRLEQALGNLVDNALAYGGGRVVLSARQARRARRAARRATRAGLPARVHRRAPSTASAALDDARTGAAAGSGSRSSD